MMDTATLAIPMSFRTLVLLARVRNPYASGPVNAGKGYSGLRFQGFLPFAALRVGMTYLHESSIKITLTGY